MKKREENLFTQKFRLLSSQESAEINWSSSESSDYENIPCNVGKVCRFSIKKSRKRKRKKTVSNNISNLDITVIDITKDKKGIVKSNDSKMCLKTEENEQGRKSPILGTTQYFSPYRCSNVPTSPILPSKTLECRSKQEKTVKSPILVLKTMPKVSPHIKKKLFKHDTKINDRGNVDSVSNNNSLIPNENHYLDRRKSEYSIPKEENCGQRVTKQFFTGIMNESNDNQLDRDARMKEEHSIDKIISSNAVSLKKFKTENALLRNVNTESLLKKNLKVDITDLSQENDTEVCVINETPDVNMNASMALLRTSSADLVKKVKHYFTNNFSLSVPSQQISDVSTPKNNSKTSDEVDITNITTQVTLLTSKNSSETKEDVIEPDKKEKKIRYKKDGLAYRLNNLLKKQTASISLWEHEKYLAENTNFVIPKCDFLALRVCKVNFKYGSYLLEAMDLKDDSYLVLINKFYSKDNILPDCIMKLYEPYTEVVFNENCKLIVNVTKFELVVIKK